MSKHTVTTFRKPVFSKTVQIASVSALIAMSGLAGCSRSDESQTAVKQAGRSFTSIAAGNPNAADSFSQKTYTETEQLVSQYAGSEDGYAEGAAVTLALAQLGQAALASQDATTAETASLHKARVIRGMINEWLTMSAIAQAAGQFDASAELAEINSLITMRQDDVQKYTTQREQMDSEIAEIDALIADLRTKADAQRNESGALELQMPRVSATQAAEIVVRVREHTLRADQYELEAMRNEGIVGQLRPGAREISLNVDKASSQIQLLEDARDELRTREASSRQDAQEARDAAVAASSRIKAAAADYAQFRDNEVNSANEKTISLTRKSISSLRDANNVIKSIASLTKSSAQQTLAESYSRQAGGHAEAAILYNALLESGVSGDWASMAQSATDAQTEAREAANEAYQNAASSLRGARVRGDEGDKLEATAVRLDQLGGVEPEPEYEESYDDENYDDENFDEEYSDDSEYDDADEKSSDDTEEDDG